VNQGIDVFTGPLSQAFMQPVLVTWASRPRSRISFSISGLLHPAKGEISFKNHPIHNAAPEEIVEHGVIQVPEGRRLFSLMTVLDNLIVGSQNSRARDRTAESLVQVYDYTTCCRGSRNAPTSWP
jgi:ABC-type branched-subunit amino acid transport system ATPase component